MAEKLPALKQLVCASIDEAKDKLHLLGDAIWRQPELAYEERQAHETLVRFFTQEKGWTVEAHYKLETAFRATCHACGHNLIAESGAAAALGLKAALESVEAWPVPIKVTVLGTPAEEGEGGKVELLHEGAFEDLDVVFMAHPTQKNATYLPAKAVQGLLVKYHGRASHASAYPWEGVNALDAAVMAYSNISVLRQQLKPDWRIYGIIKHGGVKPNIIPDYSELEFYLRTTSHRDLPIIRAKAEACFHAAAMATGCEVEFVFGKNEFHELLRNRTLEDLYDESGKALGMKFTKEGFSGSTDFGNVSHAVPGIHPYFYIGSEALNHNQNIQLQLVQMKLSFILFVLPKLWP
ncbi:hypothetical protein KOW79_005692 [Hemibagrus wyckioides]|uniref:Peptidase M20 dimerisation domain-containing protein n=1 Tax=Hemibagrus wyckioides TaxID=337641 RepID=A0A9D3P2H7_9TELE|nr:hypothetical protein KOW79_005692 [Hemibagrus wyckioides]